MQKNLTALTSLRFFAAAAIVLHHSKESFQITSGISPSIPFASGVSFFFVLSGFIMSYVYQDMHSAQSIRAFYIARIARIFPLHVVTFILAICIYPLSQLAWGLNTVTVGITNFFLLQAWVPIPAFYFSFNSVSWTISTELFFYLLFPWLAVNWHKSWHWKTLLVFLSIAILLFCTDAAHIPSYDPANLTHITNHGIANISPFSRIGEFVCGMLIGGLFIKISTYKLNVSLFLGTLLEVGSIILTVYCLKYIPSLPNWIAGKDLGQSAWNTYVVFCAGAPGFAAIIFIFAFQKGLISKAISIKPMVLLGEISFAIYMVHQLLLWLFNNYLKLEVPNQWRCLFYWIAVVAISYLLWKFIENPCRNKTRHFFDYKYWYRS